MKKILAYLTGTVFLMTILATVGCSQTMIPPATTDMSVVHIHVKAVTIDGKNHLEMYDSNDSTSVVVDTLHTKVTAGSEVYWVLANSSGIEKIKRIKPKKLGGKIFNKKATGDWDNTKYKKHKVPDNAEPGEEGYLIRVKDLEGKRWKIDPYLKIPHTAQN